MPYLEANRSGIVSNNKNTSEKRAPFMKMSGVALVTGGAGFIGSHIAAALATNGARVRIIDDLSTGHRENVEEIGGDIDFIQASLNERDLVHRALEDVELVFHEAAIPSVPRSVNDP